MNPISKRKCCENEKIDAALLFAYCFCYKYDEKEKVTNTFNELYGKECSVQNDNIIWTSPIVTDGVQLSRENINIGNGNVFFQ